MEWSLAVEKRYNGVEPIAVEKELRMDWRQLVLGRGKRAKEKKRKRDRGSKRKASRLDIQGCKYQDPR